jgi:hypothetical protein
MTLSMTQLSMMIMALTAPHGANSASSETITLKYLRNHFNLQPASDVDFFSEIFLLRN